MKELLPSLTRPVMPSMHTCMCMIGLSQLSGLGGSVGTVPDYNNSRVCSLFLSYTRVYTCSRTRVVSHGLLPVSLLDVVLSGTAADAQDLVVVLPLAQLQQPLCFLQG